MEYSYTTMENPLKFGNKVNQTLLQVNEDEESKLLGNQTVPFLQLLKTPISSEYAHSKIKLICKKQKQLLLNGQQST